MTKVQSSSYKNIKRHIHKPPVDKDSRSDRPCLCIVLLKSAQASTKTSTPP